ncbi:MAG: nucleotide sugar dehydrogenase [Candidatus Heimdallarchaeaceae archaeon]
MTKIIVKEIRSKRLYVTVLGSGYVGLPAATLFADVGFHVIAIDVKPEVVKAVNNGISPINESGLHELIRRNVQAGRLKATLNSTEVLTKADAVIISVQTPINKNKKPNLSFLTKALEEVGKTIKKRTLVVISSTVPPGTTLKKAKPKLEFLSGLKADTEFYLAYVPERIAPGKALKEFVENPRLIGGIGPNSTKIAAELFRTVCKKVIETDAATAEVAKLAENTFRDINIAFANQLALICEQHGVDAKKVIELANTHPRVNIHTSGPGVGGPCLTKDPYLLIYKTKLTKLNLIETARQVNDYMPKHIVKMTLQGLRDIGKNIKNSKIAILGTAYKANVDDSRLSPSKPIIQKLLDLNAKVVAYDPYCSESFNAKKAESLIEAVKDSDCIIIVTDHDEFKEIELSRVKKIMRSNPLIVDGRRVINPAEAKNAGFKYYGVGYGVKDEI